MVGTEVGSKERRFRLHFEGVPTYGHTLPAPALVQALQQLQRVVHLLAMADEGREVRQRARVTHAIQRRYPLICHVPEDGGYALPVDLGETSHQLFDVHATSQLAEKTREVIRAVDRGDATALVHLVPESYFRKSIVSAFSSMQPPKRSGIVVDIEDYRRAKLLSGSGLEEKIKQLVDRPPPDIATTPAYITGALIEMKFHERRLSLQLLGSGRIFEATYSDDFEPVLLDHPRELIQVHGNVVYDHNGAPSSISDVDEILDVDQSPVEVRAINYGQGTVTAKKQLVSYIVTFDQENQLYEASGPFDIVVSAETRPELENELDAELSMLWNEYALAEPSELTAAACVLREQLLDAFGEISNAY